jgi:hypothetical protein
MHFERNGRTHRVEFFQLKNPRVLFRRYEAELKKENKNEEYRDLARTEIRSIDAAIPILQKEEEYKNHLKQADDAQQTATTKRKVRLNYFFD